MQDGHAKSFLQVGGGRFQSCTSAQLNPTPELTPTLTPTLTPILWGSGGREGQSRGSAACLRVLSKSTSGRKASLGQSDQQPEVFFLPPPFCRLIESRLYGVRVHGGAIVRNTMKYTRNVLVAPVQAQVRCLTHR